MMKTVTHSVTGRDGPSDVTASIASSSDERRRVSIGIRFRSPTPTVLFYPLGQVSLNGSAANTNFAVMPPFCPAAAMVITPAPLVTVTRALIAAVVAIIARMLVAMMVPWAGIC